MSNAHQINAALLDMRKYLIEAEHINQCAARQNNLDGWTCDWSGVMRETMEEYESAKSRYEGLVSAFEV